MPSQYKNPHHHRDYRRKIKSIVIEMLGGKCLICGITDSRILQIDHILRYNHTSNESRAGFALYCAIYQNQLATDNFQLLCLNCHHIKTMENNEQSYTLINSPSSKKLGKVKKLELEIKLRDQGLDSKIIRKMMAIVQ